MQTIEVPIDDKILAQLDELVPIISESEAVRELGIVVSRETVARLALVRGLKDRSLAPPPAGAPTKVSATPDSPPKASTESVEATPVEVVEEVDLDNAGMIRIPDGWHRWGVNERIPESQSDVHSYYDRQGWRRYWFFIGLQTPHFRMSLPTMVLIDQAKQLKSKQHPMGRDILFPTDGQHNEY